VGQVSKKRTLIEFVKDKKRASCPVCQLPADVLEQLRTAQEKKITRATQLAWLHEVHGVKITDEHLAVHYGGRHNA